MKLIVNSPLAGDKVSALLGAYDKDGVTYRFLGKTGMRLEFEVAGVEGQEAIDLTKRIIRDEDFGKALYFQVMISR